MPFYTPLRYPGGKRRLSSFVAALLELNDLRDVQYVEACAGGASLALFLLFNEYASHIHINDSSRPVYAFWHQVLNNNASLCRRIERTPVTMDEWHRQRAVLDVQDDADIADLGFAAFFLNRTNRSGIISGWVIGGKEQKGKWGLDARFSKVDLMRRIQKIGRYRTRVSLYRQDVLQFTKDVVDGLNGSVFAFFDPPYIEKGEGLYLNEYGLEDHLKLEAKVARLRHPWVVTYDYEAAVRHKLYRRHPRLAFELSYSAQERRGGREAMFLSRRLTLPQEWTTGQRVRMSAARSGHPVYGRLEVMLGSRARPPHPR